MPRGLAALAALGAVACAPPILVRQDGAGKPTTFEVRSGARSVHLSGTMTGWRPRALERRGGTFELTLDLPPGRYEYRLEAVGGEGKTTVLFPKGAERVSDGYGDENAVVRVR